MEVEGHPKINSTFRKSGAKIAEKKESFGSTFRKGRAQIAEKKNRMVPFLK